MYIVIIDMFLRKNQLCRCYDLVNYKIKNKTEKRNKWRGYFLFSIIVKRTLTKYHYYIVHNILSM